MARLSIKEAAEHLNVSEITVRRRLHNGELEGEQEETPQGFRWVVLLPNGVAGDDTTDQATSSAPDQATTPAVDHELLSELRGQVTYLKQEIADRKTEHSRDRDDWRGELERLHTLMAQQGQTLQTLTRTVEQLPQQVQGPPTPAQASKQRLDTYLSQFLPQILLGVVGGGTAIISFFTVEDSQTQWVIMGMLGVGVIALVTMNRIARRLEAGVDDPQRRVRDQITALVLYLLGAAWFVAATILLALN